MHLRFSFTIFLLLVAGLLLFQAPALAQTPTYQCQIIAQHPHDRQTSTQGLFFHDGNLYESSGGFGLSFIAITEIETGRHTRKFQYEGRYFAEGITSYKNKLFLLTWLSGTGFVHDLANLDYQTSFAYRGNSEAIEGWGLTFDGMRFILSSGSARLRFYQPDDFSRTETLLIRDGSDPIRQLNELEYVGGMILANIWKSDRIAVIAPESGKVEAWIDIAPLRQHLSPDAGVANGIAYDANTGRLFVTGKHWDKLFEIRIDEVLWRQPVTGGE